MEPNKKIEVIVENLLVHVPWYFFNTWIEINLYLRRRISQIAEIEPQYTYVWLYYVQICLSYVIFDTSEILTLRTDFPM